MRNNSGLVNLVDRELRTGCSLTTCRIYNGGGRGGASKHELSKSSLFIKLAKMRLLHFDDTQNENCPFQYKTRLSHENSNGLISRYTVIYTRVFVLL